MLFADSLIPSAAHHVVDLPMSRPRLWVTTGSTCRNGLAYVLLHLLTAEIKGVKVDIGLGSWNILGVAVRAATWDKRSWGWI